MDLNDLKLNADLYIDLKEEVESIEDDLREKKERLEKLRSGIFSVLKDNNFKNYEVERGLFGISNKPKVIIKDEESLWEEIRVLGLERELLRFDLQSLGKELKVMNKEASENRIRSAEIENTEYLFFKKR